MSETYNKSNLKKMPIKVQNHYERLGSVPFSAGAELLKKIQSGGILIPGAGGQMGHDAAKTALIAGCPTFPQDINKATLDKNAKEGLSVLAKGVSKRKIPERAWVQINSEGLLHAPIVFPDKGKLPSMQEIEAALSESPDKARKFVSDFLDNALGKDTEIRKDYSNIMMVLEALPESLPLKQLYFLFLEQAFSNPEAIYATNTSSLKVDDIAAKLAHPENAALFHYFLPADRNPLLEVGLGSKTSLVVLQALQHLGTAMGKKVVTCWGDGSGAIANRILVGVLNEAGRISDEGIAQADVIDKVFLETFYPEQIKVKTSSAKRQFEAAPKLAFFKDEKMLYQKIAECDSEREKVTKSGKNPELRKELLVKKKEYILEAQGRLRQKVLYAGIVENMAPLGAFFTPAKCVIELKGKAQAQLKIINSYMADVERVPDNIIKPLSIEPYDFPKPENYQQLTNAAEVISNRLKGAYIAIAQEIIKEGLATPQDIELACKEGFKYNVGPLEMASNLGVEKSQELISLVNENIDQTKPTGISKPGEYLELEGNELSGVQTYVQDNIGFITLGRMHIQNLQMMQNSFGPEMLKGLRAAIKSLEAKGVKAIMIKSQGGGAFSSGADLNYIASTNWDTEKILAFRNLGKQVMNEVASCKTPTVAIVDGPAVGGGLELALACDYRVMTDMAVVAMPEVGLGIIPDWGGTERLPAIVGKELAKRLICTAKLKNLGLKLGAEDASKVGLADLFVTQSQLPHLISDLIYRKSSVDIYTKPSPKSNFDKPVSEYPAHIVKRFGLSRPFKHDWRWVTRHAARFAEDLIEHSDDPEYAKRVDDDEAFKVLIKSGKKVAKRYIQPFISAAQSRFWAPLLEKIGLLR